MAEYDKKGNCIHHPQIKLRKKKALRGWTVLLNDCPLCVEQKASAAQNNNNNNLSGGDNKGENIEDEYSQMQNDIIRKLAMADTNDDTPPPESSTQEQAPINNIEEQIGVDPDDYCNVDEIKDVDDIVETDTNIDDTGEGSAAVVEKEGEVDAVTTEQQPGVCYSSSSTGSSGDHSSEEHKKSHNIDEGNQTKTPATPQAPSLNTETTTSTPSLEKKMSVKDKQAWLTGAFEKKTVTPEAQNYYGSGSNTKRTPRSWEKKQYIPPPVNAGQIYNNTPTKDTDVEEPKTMSVKERQAWLKSQAFKKSPNSSPNNPRPVISSASGGIGGSGGKMSVKERQAWLTNSAFKKKDDTDSTIQSLKNRNAPDVSQWGDSPLIEKAKEAGGSVGGGDESDDEPQDGDIEKVTQDVSMIDTGDSQDVSEDDKGDSQDVSSIPPEGKEKDTEPPPEEEDFRTTVEKLVRQVMPTEVNYVDELIKEYNGREEELLNTLKSMPREDGEEGEPSTNESEEDRQKAIQVEKERVAAEEAAQRAELDRRDRAKKMAEESRRLAEEAEGAAAVSAGEQHDTTMSSPVHHHPGSWELKKAIPPPVNAGGQQDEEDDIPKHMSVKERQAWLSGIGQKKSSPTNKSYTSPQNKPVMSKNMSVKDRQAWLNGAFKHKEGDDNNNNDKSPEVSSPSNSGESEGKDIEESRRLEAERERQMEEEKQKAIELEQERIAAEEEEAARQAELDKRERARKMAEESRRIEAELEKKREEERLKAEQERLVAEEARQAEAIRNDELERLKAENARLEQERVLAEETRQAELDKLKAENAWLEKERLASDAARQAELDRLKAENERLENERMKAEIDRLNAENERLEQSRLAAEEKRRAERLEQERIEHERLLAEKAEANRIEKERLVSDAAAREAAIKKAEERAAAMAREDEMSAPAEISASTSNSSQGRSWFKRGQQQDVSVSKGEGSAFQPIQRQDEVIEPPKVRNVARSQQPKKSPKVPQQSASGDTPNQNEALYFCEKARDVYLLKGDTAGVKKMEQAIKAIQMQQRQKDQQHRKRHEASVRQGSSSDKKKSVPKSQARPAVDNKNVPPLRQPTPPTPEEKKRELENKKEQLSNLFGPPPDDEPPANAFADMLKKSRRNVLKDQSSDVGIVIEKEGRQRELSSSLPANLTQSQTKVEETVDEQGTKRVYGKVDKMSVSEKRNMLFGPPR